jgi:hypothetical protein
MNLRKQLMLMQFFRSGWFVQSINCLLLLNFINLSANFYVNDRIISINSIGKVDQLDTVSELIVEWVLNADDTTIPNDPDNQDNQPFKKIKLALSEVCFFDFKFEISENTKSSFFYQALWLEIAMLTPYSPPELN